MGCISFNRTYFFFLKFRSSIYLFIYFYWLPWVFVAAHGLSLVVRSGEYSLLRCAAFSLQWLLLLQSTGSRCMSFSSCGAWASVVEACGLSSCCPQALERRLSSCGALAYLLCGTWDVGSSRTRAQTRVP